MIYKIIIILNNVYEILNMWENYFLNKQPHVHLKLK